MPAQLVALTDGPSILLDKPILLIGRHPECDIQIDSRKVSRRHCCIAQVADYLVVRDLGSTNGIRINGVRVIEGRIKTGDELTIGNNRFQVLWDEQDGPEGHGHAIPAPHAPPARPAAAAAQPPAPAKNKGTGRPAQPLKPLVDELLESWDDPVPLPDPSANRPKPVPLSPPSDEPASLILPEHIELAPASDVRPPPPPPAEAT
jgi:predicted component of type VI protein secretion system